MRIDLQPGPDCMIAELIGTLLETKTIRANETHVILVKLRFTRPKAIPKHARESSDECIADLEDFLGETLMKYLTVTLTYRHSAFSDPSNLMLRTKSGIVSQNTQLTTKTEAKIRRLNSSSAWSPRISRTMNESYENPLIKLVESFLPAEEARKAAIRIAGDRNSITVPKRPVETSSGETVKGEEKLTKKFDSAMSSMIKGGIWSIPKSPTSSSVYHNPSLFSSTVSDLRAQETENTENGDPARKIWTEMRRASRGHGAPRRRHPRASISAGNYFTAEDDHPLARNSPQQKSNSPRVSSHQPTPVSTENEIEDKRSKVMQLAVRNKRSIGHESLRSMVPSMQSAKNKGGNGSTASLGLGWNWGRFW